MSSPSAERRPEAPTRDFIREIVAADLAAGTTPAARRHPLPAGAERLPAHRPRQVDLPQLRHRRRSSAARCHLRFDDTNPAKEEQEYVDVDRGATCAGSASTGASTCYYASDYFEQLYDWAEQLDRDGQGLRRRPDRRRDPRAPRHAHRAGHATARTATAASRRTSTCSRACAPASSPTARACCAPRSTWRRRNINLRDPVLYRILHADAPPHRRRVVHLPDVRLRARPVGRASRASRTRSARSSSRTTGRSTTGCIEQPAGAVAPAADRVRAAEPDLHGAEQAQAAAAGRRGHVARLGRSRACRRIVGPAPARLHARGDPRLLRRASAWPRRDSVVDVGAARALRARGPQPARAARAWRCCDPLKVVIENYPRARSRSSRPSTTRRTRRPARARCRSRASSRSSATTSWRSRRRSSSACRPGREVRLRYAYFITCTGVVKDAARARSSSCAAPTIPRRAAATRPTAAR